MSVIFRIRLVLLIFSGSAALIIFAFHTGFLNSLHHFTSLPERSKTHSLGENPNRTLVVASKIYVVSLPSRNDRRQQMEHLREILGLRWSYVDAIDTKNKLVDTILRWVGSTRDARIWSAEKNTSDPVEGFVFAWPEDIDQIISSNQYIEAWSPGIWHPNLTSSMQGLSPSQPIVCATGNYDIAPYKRGLPEHRILTPARLACWHSHFTTIQKIANDYDNDVTIVFEDDIDMERDIHEQLTYLWTLLPTDWDIVFLGHCWSNESYYAALGPPQHARAHQSKFISQEAHIHPSYSPKCTHAYVLSRAGARRLLLHLRYLPFAYSRAIDQALAWLVRSKRLKSYSVVPSIVVQRKQGASDVSAGRGSKWKDSLVNAVFESSL